VALGVSLAPFAAAAECPNLADLRVPGAERQESACLDDLTTAGTSQTGHTDPADWSALHARGTRNPSGVPGAQIDGYFPDTSTFNYEHGWNHDAQFVVRLPDKWNGKLVVSGASGVQRQYSNDFLIGDFVLARGYAFASTDKGNSSPSFYQDGATPGDAGAEWNERVTQLTLAVRDVIRQRYGRTPERTYVAGISQGGYVTRWQIENHPELYDGGVDWEGTLWTTDSPNEFTALPAALRSFPKYQATGDTAAHDAMIAAGFAPGSEFQWSLYYSEFWDLTQRVYREEFDPDYDGAAEGGVPFCQSGTPMCDADYDYAKRPQAAAALAKIALHGRLTKPLITLHGTLDALLPIAINSDPYARMIERAGSTEMHRYYVVEHGTHVDQNYDIWPDRLRPILPCFRQAFVALERWAEASSPAPASQFVADPRSGDVVNECALATGPAVPSPGPLVAPGAKPSTRRSPKRIRVVSTARRRTVRTRGRVVLPAGVSRSTACGSGVVTVQIRVAKRVVSTRRARLRGDCTFVVTSRLARRARRLVVGVRFSGNRALRSARATVRVR
jgi:hypothetical protein